MASLVESYVSPNSPHNWMRASDSRLDFRSEVIDAQISLFHELHTAFAEASYCRSAIEQTFNWLAFDCYSTIPLHVFSIK